MTLNQIVALAQDATFQSQCRAAALGYANSALSAAPGSNAGVNAARYQFAQQVLQDGCQAMLQRIVWAIASTGGFSAITSDSGDANDPAIESAMVSQWNTLSLISGQTAAGD